MNKKVRALNACPWCGRPTPTWRSFAVKMIQERAVVWLMRHKTLWWGKPLHGSWQEGIRKGIGVSDAWRIIGMGLKAAGIYSKANGLRDMRIHELVTQAKARMARG